MLERISFGSPITNKTENHNGVYRIIPDEFEFLKNMTIEEVDKFTLNTLRQDVYRTEKIECNADCFREYFCKSSHFKKRDGNIDGTYTFVGLYRGIPLFLDVALSSQSIVIYRERNN